MEPNAGRLLTAEELSKSLGVGKSTIYKMSVRNLIPTISWGPNLGSIRFNEAEVRVALANLERRPRQYHPPRNEKEVAVA